MSTGKSVRSKEYGLMSTSKVVKFTENGYKRTVKRVRLKNTVIRHTDLNRTEPKSNLTEKTRTEQKTEQLKFLNTKNQFGFKPKFLFESVF